MQRLNLLLLSIFTSTAMAADSVPLFNGRDLTGWVNVNCAPETWSVKDGVIHCTGVPTGAMRTTRQYENFILEVDWRHLTRGGNSGVFIWGSPVAAPGVPFLRGIEVQVLDHGYDVKGKNEWYTTHGDVFPIHGATMQPFGRHNGMRSFPSEERSKPSPEWNHYKIVCTNGVIRLHVNGKEVSGGEQCNYRKGYLALESEGAPVEFRNITIQELPGHTATPNMTAPQDLGWKSLFTGVDLHGWKTAPTTADWRVRSERISASSTQNRPASTLWTEQSFSNVEFMVDCRPGKPAEGQPLAAPTVRVGGTAGVEIKLPGAVADKYQRYLITVRDREVVVHSDGIADQKTALPDGISGAGAFGLSDPHGQVEFMNLYVRKL